MTDELVVVEPDLDLDEGRTGTFKLREEVYGIRRVSPFAYAAMLRKLDETEKNPSASLEDIWTAQLDFIQGALYPADLAAEYGFASIEDFKELREREYEGVEVRDIRRTMRFVQEVLTGRPTPPPGDSSPGPGSSDPSSKDESGEPAVVRPS